MLSCRHFTNPMISITHQLLQRAARKVLAAAAAAVPITVRDFTRSRIPASSFPVELNLQCTATYSKYGLEKPENDYLMYVFFLLMNQIAKSPPLISRTPPSCSTPKVSSSQTITIYPGFNSPKLSLSIALDSVRLSPLRVSFCRLEVC